MSEWVIGIIGGSGLYAIDALEEAQWIAVDTPWGAPSDALLIGRIEGVSFVFLPRHGRGHRIPPSQLNARANIDALKRAGCTDLVAISAVGSLREELAPGRFVVVDQYHRPHRRARERASSAPASSPMSRWPIRSARASPRSPPTRPRRPAPRSTRGGCYLAIEGPQFSTRAESRAYRAWGGDVIGMTGMPEAKLAREAELPYASVGMVTDYDCWRDGEEADVADDRRPAPRQCRHGAAADRRAGEAAAEGARALADRHHPRQCDHHRARGARSGDAGEARRDLRPGPAR